MALVQLPPRTDYDSLVQVMEQTGALGIESERVVFRVGKAWAIEAGALAFLGAWGLHERAKGRLIIFDAPPKVRGYLARVDLLRHLDVEGGTDQAARTEKTPFIPIFLIRDDRGVQDAVNLICDLILRHFDNARAFLPAMEWAACEMIDNIRLHAEAATPGVVCAHYFPRAHRLEIGVSDTGRGIKASLEENHKVYSHGHAIETAIQRGVTRNKEIGQGNGLAGANDIVRLNRGLFGLATGNASYRYRLGKRDDFTTFESPLPGTTVQITLDATNPVDLSQTFIGRPAATFIELQAERYTEEGALRISDECPHTRSRHPATALRRKILAILPDMEDPLTLDFAQIEMATSSFLDELLGRLAHTLGQKSFAHKIRIRNMNSTLRAMADVVIGQRLEQSGE